MNLEVLLVGGILTAAVVLFVTEKVRVDLVALMVMLGLVVAGILDGEEAIMGFANEAVITIASVLVLSGALARTGVARFIGQRVLAASGSGVGRLTAVMMATVGLLSGIMNDIGITALMLPVVLDMARRIGTPPSKLLMPLAFGSLLGGMTTLIGTAPNILVNGALRDAGLEPFGMFSFTPVGLTALAAGILYMTFLGRRLFPNRDPKKESAPADLGGLYGLGGLVGMLKAPRRFDSGRQDTAAKPVGPGSGSERGRRAAKRADDPRSRAGLRSERGRRDGRRRNPGEVRRPARMEASGDRVERSGP